MFPIKFHEIIKIGSDLMVTKELFTLGPQIWYPVATITDNKFKFYVQLLLCQLLPALLLDGILKLIKRKPLLVLFSAMYKKH